MQNKGQKIYKTIKKIKDVNGRLELVKNYQNNIKVFLILHIHQMLY